MSVALLGLAARERDSIALFASAILGGIACQFHPVLNVFPALLFLFALSTPQGRGLLRWRPTWLAALVLAALWAFPAQRALSHLAAGETPAHSVSAQLLQFEALVQVNQGFDHSGNTFLNPAFTPPTFALLAAIGLFAALRSRPRRWAVGVAALGAILLTLPGLQGIRMNALRQSVAAHGFLALPVGLGIATLLSLLPDSRAWRRAGGLGGASLVALSMAIWPGPLGQLFTPQHERNFIAGSIGLVPEPCTIYHPSFELGTSQEQPEYLSDPGGKRRAWKPILDSGESMRAASGCAVYFRSAACWDAETGDPAHHPEPLPGHLRPECQRIEAGTDLVPLAVTSIPARPDCEQHFLQDSVEVGLFLVRRPNPVEPAGRAGP